MPSRTEKMQAVEYCVRRVAITLICCLLWMPLPVGGAGPVTGPEYDVKIGFIYNFAKFVEWPQEAYEKSPDALVLCFASDDPSADVFYKLEGKIIRGRKLKVVAYQEGACLAESQILFLATQDKEFIQQVLSLAKGHAVLTIGEIDGFTQWGGIINFFRENNRLRFKINIDAARQEGLKMSSQLLGSAQIVQKGHE